LPKNPKKDYISGPFPFPMSQTPKKIIKNKFTFPQKFKRKYPKNSLKTQKIIKILHKIKKPSSARSKFFPIFKLNLINSIKKSVKNNS